MPLAADARPAFGADAAARALAVSLRALGSPQRAAGEQRYLKSDLEFLGVTVPDLRRAVTAAVRAQPGLDREAGVDREAGLDRRAGLDREVAVAWAVARWREPVHERRMAAVEVLRLALRQLRAADLGTVAALIRDARNDLSLLPDPVLGGPVR